MAEFKFTGLDDLMDQLDALSFDELAPKMLKKASPILEQAVKERASAHVDTGSMAKSISTTKVSADKSGYHITTRPTGRDKNGIRNMEKMAYLEFGTSKQTATPVIGPATRASKSKVEKVMQEAFNEATKEMKV